MRATPGGRPFTSRRGLLIGLAGAGALSAVAGSVGVAVADHVSDAERPLPPGTPDSAHAMPDPDAAPRLGPWSRRNARRLEQLGRPNGSEIIWAENQHPGSVGWRLTKPGDDLRGQVKAYSSATSVNLGDELDFHVSVRPAQEFTASIYRIGYYGGRGGRLVHRSPRIRGGSQPAATLHPGTKMVSCAWERSWTLRVPRTWVSGMYLAVFTNERGYQNVVPFVVREDEHPGAACVVLPFSTYQAYNQFPLNMQDGRSLYLGYTAGGRGLDSLRSRAVSFDRPYHGDGMPSHVDKDIAFVQWAERMGYDVTYVTSVDLHAGRVRPNRHRAYLFPGHDEYWSSRMRQTAEQAVAGGAHLAMLTANNLYWYVRFEPNEAGHPDRVMVCHKDREDPTRSRDPLGATVQWRQLGHPEQAFLGSMYTGIIAGTAPLVVRNAEHWLWRGTRVRNGTRLPRLVGGEADCIHDGVELPRAVEYVQLSASPFRNQVGWKLEQNTTVYQAESGGWVFQAGTFNWPLALSSDRRYATPAIQRATVNVLTRMLGPLPARASMSSPRPRRTREYPPGTVRPPLLRPSRPQERTILL